MIVLTVPYDNVNQITNILTQNNINYSYSVQFSYYDFYKIEYSEVLLAYFCFKIKKKISKKIINQIKAVDKQIILLFNN